MSSDENDDPVDVVVVFYSRFPLGLLLVTPGAEDALAENKTSLLELMRRHASGDWGDLDEEDRAANDATVASGEDRILSSYVLPTNEKVWIITEADRSATTALLPEEY